MTEPRPHPRSLNTFCLGAARPARSLKVARFPRPGPCSHRTSARCVCRWDSQAPIHHYRPKIPRPPVSSFCPTTPSGHRVNRVLTLLRPHWADTLSPPLLRWMPRAGGQEQDWTGFLQDVPPTPGSSHDGSERSVWLMPSHLGPPLPTRFLTADVDLGLRPGVPVGLHTVLVGRGSPCAAHAGLWSP